MLIIKELSFHTILSLLDHMKRAVRFLFWVCDGSHVRLEYKGGTLELYFCFYDSSQFLKSGRLIGKQGGAIVYRIALWYPNLVTSIFAICTPYHAPSKSFTPLETLVQTAKKQLMRLCHTGIHVQGNLHIQLLGHQKRHK